MLRYLRAVLRPFAIQAAYSPIESIVFFSVIGTLAYFHILNAIKHSSFFAPSLLPPLRPAQAILSHTDGLWLSIPHHNHIVPIELQQLVFTLPSNSTTPLLHSSILNATTYLSTSFKAATSGLSYPSTCYRSIISLNSSNCFIHQSTSPHTFTLSLAFSPGAREDYVSALLRYVSIPDSSGTSFAILPNGPASPEPIIGQMKSSKWMAYAARALVLRFYTLALKADSLDILLILLGYILMHTTFYLLISRSRALGSNFWLPCAIMSSSVLALLLSLPIAMALRIPIDPVALTEALPFLVCTVGFDKPLRLARAVFLHPHLTTPPVALSSLPPSTLSPSHPNHHALPLKPAAKILTESLKLTYHPIIRDYILEIAVLLVGANSKVVGLREVCALAAILLAVDCFVMITYLVSVLGVMIEVRSHLSVPRTNSYNLGFFSQVRRIQAVRAMTRSTRSRASSISSVSSVSTRPIVPSSGRPSAMAQALAPPTLSERILGVKGASLVPVKGSKASRKEKERNTASGENPVARLKLLLIASFTTLHILNLITPLAPNYAHHTHSLTPGSLSMTSSGAQEAGLRRVDITEKGVKGALDALALAVGAKQEETEEDEDELLVKVFPPMWVRVIPSHEFLPQAQVHSTSLERFMSSWTRLVGDPVLSKWIVVVLAISISLNGYLLKGIAAGLGLGLGLVRKEADGVRFSDGENELSREEQEERKGDKAKSGKDKRDVVPTFTLQDVDRRLELKANGVKKRRGTVGPAQSPAVSPVAPSRAYHLPTPPAPTTPARRVHAPAPVPFPSTPSLPAPEFESGNVHVHVRTLKECIEIYENGPGPASVALDTLNDEEVIMLAQNGKIAAYALEKVLGSERLERAVRVRRALVCEFFLFSSLLNLEA